MPKSTQAGEVIERVMVDTGDRFIIQNFGLAAQRGRLYFAAVFTAASAQDGPRGIVIARLAADNFPDPAYGIKGCAEVMFPAPLNEEVEGIAMILQEDGGVVIVVRNAWWQGEGIAGLARFTSRGILDTTWGDNGIKIHYLQSPVDAPKKDDRQLRGGPCPFLQSGSSSGGAGAVLLADGKIAYAATLWVENRGLNIGLLARFLPNGNLDKEFGTSGITEFSPPGAESLSVTLRALTELPGGGIAACGSVYKIESERISSFQGLIVQCLKDGAIDRSFADNGFAFSEVPGEPEDNEIIVFSATSIAAGRDASLMVSSVVILVPAPGTLLLRSYGGLDQRDRNGRPIPSFNNGKPVIFAVLGRESEFHMVAIQGDEKPVVIGSSKLHLAEPGRLANGEFIVARYDVDGRRDLTFAGQGFTTASALEGNHIGSIVHLVDDTILVAGHVTLTEESGLPRRMCMISFSA